MRLRFLISLFLIVSGLKAQITEFAVRGVLIQKFASNIEWPRNSFDDYFVVGIAGSDSSFYNKFSELAQGKEIHRNPIKVLYFNNPESVQHCDLLYVDPDENYQIQKYWHKVENSHTLFISENLDNVLYSMINIDYSPATSNFSFVLNSSNLHIANLKALPNLLLVGGTEVDVRDLYRQTQKKLDDELKKVRQQRQVIQRQMSQIDQLDENLLSQSTKLDEQFKVIKEQEQNISSQTNRLDSLSSRIAFKEDSIAHNKEVIATQQATIRLQKQSVYTKEYELNRLNDQLEFVAEQIREKQLILQENQKQLEQKEAVISNQKLYLYIAVVGIFFILLMLAFFFYAYRSKTIANRRLDEKNIMLEEHQTEIKKQSALLVSINNRLNKQKKELTVTIDKLKETQAQLVHSEKMASLGTLTAGIAHEINNPINFITTGIEGLKTVVDPLASILESLMKLDSESNIQEQVEALLKHAKEEEVDELIEGLSLMIGNIEVGATRATDIIKGLNNFSRSGDTEVTPVDIRENIESTLLILNSEIKNKVSVSKIFAQTPLIHCYSGRINQVLLNIIGNGIQAIEDTGEIQITTEMAGADHIKIKIADNGSGIKPENLEHIFEPFFTTKPVGKGTGLGLAISYTIVEQHNGALTVKSELGKGTEFTIKLPVKAS